MFHICFAMTVKSIGATVRYGFKNALSEWGWLLLVGGSVVVATLTYLGVMDMEMSKMVFIGIGGVSAIGIYLLNNLRRNIFVNIGAGLWDTYNMATGLMGDLLSYLRLYALGLAGGMLGGVFNDLGMQLRNSIGDVLFGIPGWIAFALIFVAGHGLNIALSCLSGYVHSIRLTFVEYFKNSGYDGKGMEYKPFSSKKKND
jgi:V/A-type H+-transporting ATPase subunit I